MRKYREIMNKLLHRVVWDRTQDSKVTYALLLNTKITSHGSQIECKVIANQSVCESHSMNATPARRDVFWFCEKSTNDGTSGQGLSLVEFANCDGKFSGMIEYLVFLLD